MDSIFIKQLVDKQLLEKGIEDGVISILEKKWGYVAQIEYGNMKYSNEVFDKYGNVIHPLGNFKRDSGEIYRTEVIQRDTKYGKQTFTVDAIVRYKELDDNHFIIPRIEKKEIGNVLFFIDENNNVTYKGYIKGRICGNALTENKRLIQQKQVLSHVEIDATRDEYEYFFYSWDRNCRTSDKWSWLNSPENVFNAKDILINRMKLPIELTMEIIKYMQSNGAWLGTLNLNSKDNKHQRNFVCLLGINGIPLIDLTYISQTYSVDTIPLKKERIGEVDDIKRLLQNRMDQQVSQIEENKENLASNFFKVTGLGMKKSEVIEDKDTVEEDIDNTL